MKKLQVDPDAMPPSGLPVALKELPRRLVALAYRAGAPTRKAIALAAGKDAAQVGRWLSYTGLEGFEAQTIIALEESYKLDPGMLLSPLPLELGGSSPPMSVASTAALLGIDPSVVEELLNRRGETMREFGEELPADDLYNLKRAILGAVHLLGHPLGVATTAARRLLAEKGSRDLSPEGWLGELRAYLPKKTESGNFPSSGSIKLG